MQNFKRGETIAIAVRNISNVAWTSARAVVKKADLTGEELIEFDVTYLQDLGGALGPGWLLVATPQQSLQLPKGTYATDLRVVLASDAVEISETELIEMAPAVTETA